MFPSSSTTDLPVFTVSTPDLTDLDGGTTSGSAFPTPYAARTPLLRARSQSPLAVASCPIPPNRANKAFFPSPVRKFMGRLRGATTERRKASTPHRVRRGPFLTLTSPRSPKGVAFAPARRATLSGGRSAVRRPLTICNPGFYSAATAVNGEDGSDSNVADDENDGEEELNDAAGGQCATPTPLSRAPPPTPADPFRTPPPTPLRGAVFVTGRGTSSVWQRLSGSPRRREQKKMKILQVMGPEAARIAERVTGAGVQK
ncbi:hypothetical protein C8R46DRAFT_1216969 [Mycena filopes]|nr:hypothetical protein C8R46DRAFT_1216969 [Mycena filopes]